MQAEDDVKIYRETINELRHRPVDKIVAAYLEGTNDALLWVLEI